MVPCTSKPKKKVIDCWHFVYLNRCQILACQSQAQPASYFCCQSWLKFGPTNLRQKRSSWVRHCRWIDMGYRWPLSKRTPSLLHYTVYIEVETATQTGNQTHRRQHSSPLSISLDGPRLTSRGAETLWHWRASAARYIQIQSTDHYQTSLVRLPLSPFRDLAPRAR